MEQPDGVIAALADLVERRSSAAGTGTTAARVRVAQEIALAAENRLTTEILRARDEGVAWQVIAEILGVSRQAAFKRFGTVRDPETGETMIRTPVVDTLARAEGVFRALADGDYASVKELMTFSTSRLLTKTKVMQVWKSVLSEYGEFAGVEASFVSTPAQVKGLSLMPRSSTLGNATVQTTLRFEAGEMVGRVSFTNQGRINGILILDPTDLDGAPF
ncbi:hypothetical protein D1871_08495 [Nakamurella silvestris]|nr:hypothetical protein D1871_08495 [Nakamurella silvestris]